MNKKEIGEIRRRLCKDRCSITKIFGCYVSDDKKIISEFEVSMGLLKENEQDKYLALFKKLFSGAPGKTLMDLIFTTSMVANKDEQHLSLMNLREQKLIATSSRRSFLKKVISSVDLDSKYVILAAADSYDVPFKNKNDTMDADAGNETFSYILCAVCPVKEKHAHLHYDYSEEMFHDGGMMQAVSNPELGFMFPAFNNRSTDIYGAMYYSKDTKNIHPEFIKNIFGVALPPAADDQKRFFAQVLVHALGEDCQLEIIQALHQQILEHLELHKESKSPDPLVYGIHDLKSLLAAAGASEANLKAFEKEFSSVFGAGTEIYALNIINTKRCDVLTGNLKIRTTPSELSSIEMRKIGGVDYLLIPATDYIDVDGISVSLN